MPDEKTLDRILREIAAKHDVSSRLIREMIETERNKLHLERRRGITRELRALLDHEIRSGSDEGRR